MYNTSEIMPQEINTAKFILDKTFAAYIKHASECLWMITFIWKLWFDLPYYEFADRKDGTSAFSKRLTPLNWPPRLYRIYKTTSLSNKQLGFFSTYSRSTSIRIRMEKVADSSTSKALMLLQPITHSKHRSSIKV